MTRLDDVTFAPTPPAVLATLAKPVEHRVVRPVARALQRRRTAAALSRLDDRMLRDIGLSRADIPKVAGRLAGPESRRAPVWARLLESLRAARRRHAVIRDLERMPDWLLNDIGIPRHDIEGAVDRMLAQQAQEAGTTRAPARSPVHDLVQQVESAVRPLRQWHLSRVAAGQLARLDPEAMADLGYVKGDVDWVPEVLAKRSLENTAEPIVRRAGAA
ncbi:MAG: DUF1127 domain-containing protein [Kiloniellaceae bacterium]